jgi:hypothetical protein
LVVLEIGNAKDLLAPLRTLWSVKLQHGGSANILFYPLFDGAPWHSCISLYSSKTVDKKEILRAISNAGIYCSSDKVGTVYPV